MYAIRFQNWAVPTRCREGVRCGLPSEEGSHYRTVHNILDSEHHSKLLAPYLGPYMLFSSFSVRLGPCVLSADGGESRCKGKGQVLSSKMIGKAQGSWMRRVSPCSRFNVPHGCPCFLSRIQTFLRPPGLLRAARRHPACRSYAPDIQPASEGADDLDSVVLDDKYYKEMGMSQEDIEDQQALAADDIDPEAANYSLEDLFSPRDGTPQEIIDAYYSKDVYGPEVCLPFLLQCQHLRLCWLMMWAGLRLHA